MLLRSYRYKHEKNCSGNLEDKPIKQIKPKAKPIVKVAPPPPLQTVEEPQAVKQSIYQESKSIKPLSVLDDYFKQIQMQKQQQADQIFNKMVNSNSKTRARKR